MTAEMWAVHRMNGVHPYVIFRARDEALAYAQRLGICADVRPYTPPAGPVPPLESSKRWGIHNDTVDNWELGFTSKEAAEKTATHRRIAHHRHRFSVHEYDVYSRPGLPASAEKAGRRYGVWCIGSGQSGWLLDSRITLALREQHQTFDTEAEAEKQAASCRSWGMGVIYEVRPYPGSPKETSATAIRAAYESAGLMAPLSRNEVARALEIPPLPCSDCGAAPCDCEREIWTYWFRLAPGDAPQIHMPYGQDNQRYRTRSDMAEKYAETRKAWPDYKYGPIQRVTDPPPHDFEIDKNATVKVAFPKDWTAAQAASFQKDWDSMHSPLARTPQASFAKWIPPVEATRKSAIDPADLPRVLFDIEMNDEALRRGEGPAMRAADGCSLEQSVAATERALDIMWNLGKPIGENDPPGTKEARAMRAARARCTEHAKRAALRAAWRAGRKS